MRIDIAGSVDTFDQKTWDDVSSASSFYSSPIWLRYLERRDDAVVNYLLARAADGNVTTVLPTYYFTGPVLNPFYDPEVLLGGVAGMTRSRPLLLGGAREGYSTELISRADRSRKTVVEEHVWPLFDDFRRRAADQRATGAMLYLTDETVELLAPRLTADDRLAVIDASASLRVPAGGCAEYIAQMPQKKRGNINREILRFQELGFSVELASFRDCYGELAALSAAHLSRYGHAQSEEKQVARFSEQAAELGDLARLFVARRNGIIAGFVLFFEWNGVLYSRTIGLDTSVPRRAALYFNLAYYSVLDYAAEAGISMIDYGCDAIEAKVLRGAQLKPLWGLFLDQGPSSDSSVLRAKERQKIAEFLQWDERIVTSTVAAYSTETVHALRGL
jgi:hypothetical protein